jgi:uncharacterized protein (DUF1810 family)
MSIPDPHNLERFVTAQANHHNGALAELRAGRKTGHWMWFVFPQIAGLGSTPTSQHYAIRSLDEARAYLDHPVLGPRLRACTDAILGIRGRSAEEIFTSTDAKKLRSSMTLFHRAAPDEPRFGDVLDRYFDGRSDERTDALLGGGDYRGW